MIFCANQIKIAECLLFSQFTLMQVGFKRISSYVSYQNVNIHKI